MLARKEPIGLLILHQDDVDRKKCLATFFNSQKMQFEKSVCKSCSYVRSWNYDETLSGSKWFQFSLCFVQVHSFNVYSEDFSSRVEFPGIPVPESRESQWFFHSREWKYITGMLLLFPLIWGNFPLNMKNWIVFY